MGKYKYEKFQIKAGKKVYILSQHEGESWDGLAIEHLCKENATNIGYMNGQRKFAFEAEIIKPDGTEYVIRENNKEGYPNGPVIVMANNTLYFGPYYAKKGFHGIVYKVKQGQRVIIQEYKHGVLVDECYSDNTVYENVAIPLSFDAWYEVESDELVERKLNNKQVKGVEFIAGDPSSHLTMIAARQNDGGNTIVGLYANNTFEGLGLEYSPDNNLYGLKFYDNGVEKDDFTIMYLPELSKFSVIMKNTQIRDGKTVYISLLYGKKDNSCEFGIQYLDGDLNLVGDIITFPNYIDPTAEKPYGPVISKPLAKFDENGFTAKERLKNLIGLTNVKKELDLLQAFVKKNPGEKMTLNMCFYGNPGTGKTEVARLLAEILYNEGILKENKLTEVDPSGLIAKYVGQTQDKTHNLFKKALNGVLFIDEAYNLASGSYVTTEGSDFGAEAIGALLQDMETYRGQICVILAGYRKPMEDMISVNPGFTSRINRKIDFPDYSEEELQQIASLIVNKLKYSADKDVINTIAKQVFSQKFLDGYANARDVRNFVEKLTEVQALRTIDEPSNRTLTMEDINTYLEKAPAEKEEGKTAEERLNELIGLDDVKDELKKMFALIEKNKGDVGKTNLHMCFYGNPGTGKTEVANLIANILYDKGILLTNKCVATNASGLIADYTGQTGHKTHDVVKSALNGVLFIDEAYALNDNGHGYGKEAIAALLEDMENYRGKFCVILAGYRNDMEKMIALNDGFDSRINRKIDFPDYTTNELLQISQLMINNKKYSINDDAKTELGDLFLYMKEYAKVNNKPFANAREVRNVLESIYEIQALRTVDEAVDDFVITIDDIKSYEEDHNIDLSKPKDKPKKHEFHINYHNIDEISKCDCFNVDTDYITKVTVNIKVETKDGVGEGSGFFIEKHGLIATCAHVVKNAEKITVIVNYKTDRNEFITKDYAAEVITFNEYDDTALIGIISKNIDVNYYQLKPRGAGYPKLLSKIIMGGYPLGGNRFANISINEGTVQSINQDAFGGNDNMWIYADLKGLPGNSGSGVINAETGQIEGIFAGCSIDPNEPSLRINRIIPVEYLWNLLSEYTNVDVKLDMKLDDVGASYSYKYSNSFIDEAKRDFRVNSYDERPKEIKSAMFDNIKIVKGDVTTYTGDAIVNAANKYLAPGSGVCGAIFRGAGYKELETACRLKGEQEVGSATLTSGFNLPASYIIHAVGPRYDFDRNPERLLANVYKNCFDVAKENNIKSIAFPSISTGIYHFPISLACPIALREMMERSSEMNEIVVYCFDDNTYNVYVDTLNRLKGQR